MISQTDKDKAKKLGIDIDAIIAAHTDAAEKPITLPEGQILTDAQLTERDNTKLADGEKIGEGKAKTALIKEVAAKAGLTITGERIADLVVGIKEGLSKDKDAAYKTLQDQNTALLTDITTYKTKAEQAEQALSTGMFELDILTKLPPHAAGLTAKESFELAKMRGYAPEKTETGIVWKDKNGVIKDPVTHAPLPEDKAIATIWEREKWGAVAATQQPSGRGGADSNPAGKSGFKTQSEAIVAWKEQNPGANEVSPAAMAFVQAAAKAEPTFDWSK